MAGDGSESESIWTYNPNFAAAVNFAVFYAVPTCVLFWQTLIKYRSWFFLCVLIGSVMEVAGYCVRSWSIKNQSSIPAYAASSTLIIVAPVFVAAGNYLLIGRLIRAVLPTGHHRVFGIPARFITKLFVFFDILSFFVQCAGTTIASTANWVGSQAVTGTNVLIGGLSLQAATFIWYLTIVMRFWQSTKTVGVREDAPVGWFRVLQAIWISSSLILVRCVFRVIEFALGVEGYPFKHEWMFYMFESLPMLPAIIVFCFIHPAKYLGSKGGLGKVERLSEDATELRGSSEPERRRDRRSRN